MNSIQEEPTEIAKQFDRWLDQATCVFDTAVTLTFRQDPESHQVACEQLTYFLNKLNDACIKKNWSRKAKHDPSARVGVVAVIEDGFGKKRLHYHCVFARPTHIEPSKFRLLINLCWDDTWSGGGTRNDVQQIYDRLGFSGYMTKELHVNDFEKLDEKNTHIY